MMLLIFVPDNAHVSDAFHPSMCHFICSMYNRLIPLAL